MVVGVMALRTLAAILLLSSSLGAARAEAVRVTDAGGRVTDWSAGELRARGLGVSDRRAPSPATARDAARLRALVDARRKLVAAARALPWAGGGTLGEVLGEQALVAAVELAQVRGGEPLVDGSWRLELALPLEVLRQAVTGPRVVALEQGDAGALPLLLVQVAASAASAGAPALGPSVSVAGRAISPAVLWARSDTSGVPVPAAALARAPTVAGELRSARGALTLTLGAVAGKAAVTHATLLVVVLGQ